MCWIEEADFAWDATSASEARLWVAGHLEHWGLVDLTDTAMLLTSELVSNAVVHAASGPSVEVSIGDGFAEVGVSDNEVRLPRLAPGARPDDVLDVAEGGRGLMMVEALADEWGATMLTAGKIIWFRLRATEWEGGHNCACADDGVDRVVLRSGRYLHVQGSGR